VLRQLGLQESDTLEVVALDSFVAQIPGALALRQQAPPWLAIEEEGALARSSREIQQRGPFLHRLAGQHGRRQRAMALRGGPAEYPTGSGSALAAASGFRKPAAG
jgi:hypothetical protein